MDGQTNTWIIRWMYGNLNIFLSFIESIVLKTNNLKKKGKTALFLNLPTEPPLTVLLPCLYRQTRFLKNLDTSGHVFYIEIESVQNRSN